MGDLKEKNPYVSIVMASRNDDHGGNMLRRMQVSLSGLLEQLEKYRLESELILVDWNPPGDKPPLKEVIDWPSELKYCTVRIIEVPLSIHQRYQYADKVPMNMAVALNCGIRRARGKFILPGIVDLLYPDELISHIASKNLKENECYRVNRCNVNRNILEYNTLSRQLEYCQQNIIHIHRYQPYSREGLPGLHTDACGDFQLMSKDYWNLLRGYRETSVISGYMDGLLSYAAYAAGVKEVILEDPMRIYHIDHDGKFTDRIKISRPPFEKLLSFFFKPLRSFLPLSISNKMVFFYHKLIGGRSKSKEYGIPVLDYVEYLNLARDMVAGRRSYVFNDESWGLGQDVLREFIIRKGDWDKE